MGFDGIVESGVTLGYLIVVSFVYESECCLDFWVYYAKLLQCMYTHANPLFLSTLRCRLDLCIHCDVDFQEIC